MPPSPTQLRRAGLVWAVGGALSAGWMLLTWRVHQVAPGVPELDANLHTLAVTTRTADSIDVALAVTRFGEVAVALPLAVIGAILVEKVTRPGARLRAGLLMLAVAGAGILVGLGLNYAIGRERPSPNDWAGAAGGASFPSGHTTAATVAAMLLAWAVTRRFGRSPVSVVAWVVALVWAVGVGWSRVWLGVHWPTDVLCAWLFVPSLLVIARAIQLTWWPADAPPVPVVPDAGQPAEVDVTTAPTEVAR